MVGSLFQPAATVPYECGRKEVNRIIKYRVSPHYASGIIMRDIVCNDMCDQI